MTQPLPFRCLTQVLRMDFGAGPDGEDISHAVRIPARALEPLLSRLGHDPHAGMPSAERAQATQTALGDYFWRLMEHAGNMAGFDLGARQAHLPRLEDFKALFPSSEPRGVSPMAQEHFEKAWRQGSARSAVSSLAFRPAHPLRGSDPQKALRLACALLHHALARPRGLLLDDAPLPAAGRLPSLAPRRERVAKEIINGGSILIQSDTRCALLGWDQAGFSSLMGALSVLDWRELGGALAASPSALDLSLSSCGFSLSPRSSMREPATEPYPCAQFRIHDSRISANAGAPDLSGFIDWLHSICAPNARASWDLAKDYAQQMAQEERARSTLLEQNLLSRSTSPPAMPVKAFRI